MAVAITHRLRTSERIASLNARPSTTIDGADDDVPAHPVVDVVAVRLDEHAVEPGLEDADDVAAEVDQHGRLRCPTGTPRWSTRPRRRRRRPATRWAGGLEDEIGRNSVRPCTTDRTTTCNHDIDVTSTSLTSTSSGPRSAGGSVAAMVSRTAASAQAARDRRRRRHPVRDSRWRSHPPAAAPGRAGGDGRPPRQVARGGREENGRPPR